MDRFTALSDAAMTPHQAEVAARIAEGARGGVKGPYAALLHAPELADRFQHLGRHIRWGTSFPPRLSELAIIVTAARWRARHEWHAHGQLALEAGLPPAALEAIRRRERPEGLDEAAAAVHDFARALVDEGDVPDALFARCKELFGERGCAELVAICGFYVAVGFVLNVARVPLPPGVSDPFPPAAS